MLCNAFAAVAVPDSAALISPRCVRVKSCTLFIIGGSFFWVLSRPCTNSYVRNGGCGLLLPSRLGPAAMWAVWTRAMCIENSLSVRRPISALVAPSVVAPPVGVPRVEVQLNDGSKSWRWTALPWFQHAHNNKGEADDWILSAGDYIEREAHTQQWQSWRTGCAPTTPEAPTVTSTACASSDRANRPKIAKKHQDMMRANIRNRLPNLPLQPQFDLYNREPEVHVPDVHITPLHVPDALGRMWHLV